MLDTLQAWDEALLLLLNGQPSWLAPVAWWLTSKWATLPVVVLLLIQLFARRSWKKGLLGLAMFAACVGGTDAISSRLMKPGFERLRPSHHPQLSGQLHLHEHADGSVYRGGRFGFVSSHAANTFGLATLAVLLFGGGRWRWLFGFAALVSWTRIYLGVHYPGDILFGALLGAGWASALFTLFSRFQRLNPPSATIP
ncbi:MAG: phosphatase PAP2 family protein [Crocinitomicaceae bacterium TMED114]|nr:MAG: phosphatase PAP2 family protein [Crocinitomicaceae bacterium TMED114]